MPELGDYLGHILAEVAMARVKSDLESVRIAEIYAGHPLLKHMPVPHFRLPTVEFDLPVALGDVRHGDDAEQESESWDLERMKERFFRILGNVMEKNGFEYTSQDRASAEDQIQDQLEHYMEHPREVRSSLTVVIQDLMKIGLTPVRQRAEEDEAIRARLPTMRQQIQDRAAVAYLKMRSKPSRLGASVGTSEIRGESHKTLARVKLKVVEEGMEWARTEDEDGDPSMRLVSE